MRNSSIKLHTAKMIKLCDLTVDAQSGQKTMSGSVTLEYVVMYNECMDNYTLYLDTTNMGLPNAQRWILNEMGVFSTVDDREEDSTRKAVDK